MYGTRPFGPRTPDWQPAVARRVPGDYSQTFAAWPSGNLEPVGAFHRRGDTPIAAELFVGKSYWKHGWFMRYHLEPAKLDHGRANLFGARTFFVWHSDSIELFDFCLVARKCPRQWQLSLRWARKGPTILGEKQWRFQDLSRFVFRIERLSMNLELRNKLVFFFFLTTMNSIR